MNTKPKKEQDDSNNRRPMRVILSLGSMMSIVSLLFLDAVLIDTKKLHGYYNRGDTITASSAATSASTSTSTVASSSSSTAPGEDGTTRETKQVEEEKVQSTVSSNASTPTPTPTLSSLEQQYELLNSLQYYVDGEWTSTCGSDELIYANVSGSKKKKRLIGLKCLNSSSSSTSSAARTHYEEKGNLDIVYYVPKRLVPIGRSNSSSSNDIIELDPRIRYRRYNPSQAAECLQNKRILFLGDSHMRNFWRGMLDTLATNGFHNMHDYPRWDGYNASSPMPQIPFDDHEQANRVLPNMLYARSNDHSKIGVPGACTLDPVIVNATNANTTSNSSNSITTYKWKCDGTKALSKPGRRQKHDIRYTSHDTASKYNITIHASWCASGLRVGLQRGKIECRDSGGMRDTDHFRSLLVDGNYDMVVAGFHSHDIKGGNCKGHTDKRECRVQLGEEYVQNAEILAKYATENNVPLVWTTSGAQDKNLIPEQYQPFQLHSDMDVERSRVASVMKKYGVPVLDSYHISNSCLKWSMRKKGTTKLTCLEDGMHRNRFLVRMQTQTLLNWKCNNGGGSGGDIGSRVEGGGPSSSTTTTTTIAVVSTNSE